MSTRIPVKNAIITGRNGTVEIKEIEISEFSNQIRLDGISKSRGIAINGGISFLRCAVKELANALLATAEQ